MVKESREKNILPDSEEKARSVQGPLVIGLVACPFTASLLDAGFPRNGLHGRRRCLSKDAGTRGRHRTPRTPAFTGLLSMDHDHISNDQRWLKNGDWENLSETTGWHRPTIRVGVGKKRRCEDGNPGISVVPDIAIQYWNRSLELGLI